MKTTYYEVINQWIESRPKDQKVHKLTDKDIADLKSRLVKAGIFQGTE